MTPMNPTIMDTLYDKSEYRAPESAIVEIETSGIICQSNETIDPGQGHEW